MRHRESARALHLTTGTEKSEPDHSLRLRFPDSTIAKSSAADSTGDIATEPRLLFPRKAVDTMMAAKRSFKHACPITDEIERTLDHMQRQLDVLKDDAQHYRFPTLDGPPLKAA